MVKEVPPRFLVRNWPPAFTEWNTKAVRDVFFAAPQFPRLLFPDTIKETIARGVCEGHIAYATKSLKGEFDQFVYKKDLKAENVEIADDVFILTPDEAEKHIQPPQLSKMLVSPEHVQVKMGNKHTFTVDGLDQFGREFHVDNLDWKATGGIIDTKGVFTAGPDEGSFVITVKSEGKECSARVIITKEETMDLPPVSTVPKKLAWTGEIAPQKWTNFYMKVLTKLVTDGDLKIRVNIEGTLKENIADQRVDETKAALRELGLDDNVDIE